MQPTLEANPRACWKSGGLELFQSGASRQDQQVQRAGQTQRQPTVVMHQRALGPEPYLAGTEPGVFYRPWDLGRIETRVLFGVNDRLTAGKIDFDVTDAIQAPQGLLGPVGSQRSRHAVDPQMGLFDLGESRTDTDGPGEARRGKSDS